VVRLTPEAVVVEYRLELDETTGARELPEDELKGISTRKELHNVISRYFSEILADNLVASLDGTALRFSLHAAQPCSDRSHPLRLSLCSGLVAEARRSPYVSFSREQLGAGRVQQIVAASDG